MMLRCLRGRRLFHTWDSMELTSRGRKSEYIAYLKSAATDKDSLERTHLNHFLVRCFMDADSDFDGKVCWPTFNFLIDTATATPRHYGILVSRAEKYATRAALEKSRREMFDRIDDRKVGFIRLQDWLEFYHEFFLARFAAVDTTFSRSKMHSSKEDFAKFIVAACKTRTSFEYKELYRFLTYCFLAADPDQTGTVSGEDFEVMIEMAAATPRKFGFESEQVFENEEERSTYFTGLFKAIKAKSKVPNEDFISFDEWIEYSYERLCIMAKDLDPTLTGAIPRPVGELVAAE